MRNKIILLLIGLAAIFVGGCGSYTTKKSETETINPFSPTSMVKTYDRSKVKINTAVEKENSHLEKTLNDAGV